MTPTKRAKKIHKIGCNHILYEECLRLIAAQIAEAELVAYDLGRSKAKLDLDGAYERGFDAAREKAAAICEDHWSSPDTEIAERIRAMEVGK